VPFGGGTSVVGGVEALRDGLTAAVTLDLARLDSLEVDRRSLLATFGAGLPARTAEVRLQARGLTLGHFPQSYEFASIGGYVATRSAGQASTGYGRIDELTVGLRMVAPAGTVEVRPVPASAAGPSVRELLVGSEGTLGVITQATLSVRPAPPAREYLGWSFPSFAAGIEAFRDVEQSHASPDVMRLSDEEESAIGLAMSDTGSLANRAARAYLRVRGHGTPCLVITGFEGPEKEVARRASQCASILSSHGAVRLGRRPGRTWLRTRYFAPYLRDVLLDGGVLAETLETATIWSRLEELHDAVGDALRAALAEPGTRPLVACHVSHVYPAGASLYFTFMARAREGAELDQWRAAKQAASDAILDHGGTITHHHAVGHDHAAWMRREIGDLGLAALRAAKERFDPRGIMNPGKLLPPEQRGA
jgi:alkyldihydroxyacetonephosphate synthase